MSSDQSGEVGTGLSKWEEAGCRGRVFRTPYGVLCELEEIRRLAGKAGGVRLSGCLCKLARWSKTIFQTQS